MEIKINNEIVLALSETQKKVIMNDIPQEIFEEDMKRRVHYILTHKYERCLHRLKEEWMPKLKERMQTVPTSDEALATLIFSQPDYKNRSQRDTEK